VIPAAEAIFMTTSYLRFGISGLILLFSGWLLAATPTKEDQTTGVVQQWAPSARTIKVEGSTFQTGIDFQVLDRRGRKISPQTVRPGTRVMVLSIEGVALQVIVDPADDLPFDLPQQ
jgi:hypothetical protein